MKKFGKRILDLEKKIKPNPPAVIFSQTVEEAAKKIKQFYNEYPNGSKPIVYICPDIKKPANSGLSE